MVSSQWYLTTYSNKMSDGKVIPVKVALRIRPLVTKELTEGCRECVEVIPGVSQLLIGKDKAFTYDYVFSSTSSQDEIFAESVDPLVSGIFKGYNATVLAYGQTGSGKTFTMGTSFSVSELEDEDKYGVIPRVIQKLFKEIEDRKDQGSCMVKVSFLEIHNEEINDLLHPSSTDDKITIREMEGSIKIAGLTEVSVSSMPELVRCLEQGSACRATASTAMNAVSSRSHAIFTLTVEQRLKSGDFRKAKFHLVDLAGSERAKRTLAQGERLKEGININKGLLSLGNVISALGDEQRKVGSFVPYRDSKLTRLLQDSLGGNSHTLMVACISPADSNFDETLSTLRYADRARKIKNKPVVNRDPAAAELARLREHVNMLQLQLLQNGSPDSTTCASSNDGATSEQLKELKERIDQLEVENEKLSIELHSSIDQTTLMCEKAMMAELSKESVMRNLEDFKKQMRNAAETSEEDSKPAAALMQELEKRIEEIEGQSTLSLAETVSQDTLRGDENVAGSEDAEKVDGENSEHPEGMSTELMDSTFATQHNQRQADLSRQLQELTKALVMKEELMNKMGQNDSKINAVKHQYEVTVKELEEEIKNLEKEKLKLNSALETAKSTAGTKLDAKQRVRLKELESQISELKKKQVEHQKLQKMKHQSDQTIDKLHHEIQAVKTARVKLMRLMKEEAENFRMWRKQKDKEILQLKQQGRKRQFAYQKLEIIHDKQKAVLKRKTEEAAAANKRLKDALNRQKDAADKRMQQQSSQNKQIDGIAVRMKSWLTHEIEVIASVQNARQTMDDMIEDRKVMSQQLVQLRTQRQEILDQPPAKKRVSEIDDNSRRSGLENLEKEIQTVQLELDVRNSHVANLQQKIIDAESGSGLKSKTRWNSIHTMAEAKACLQILLQNCVENKVLLSPIEKERDEAKTAMKTLEVKHQKTVIEYEKDIITLKENHDKEISDLRKEHEEKVQFLFQQLPPPTSVPDPKLIEKLEEQEKLIAKVKEENEQQEKLIAKLTEEKDQFLAPLHNMEAILGAELSMTTPSPKEKSNDKREKRKLKIFKSPLSPPRYVSSDEDLWSSGGETDENRDPTYIPTPVMKRTRRTRKTKSGERLTNKANTVDVDSNSSLSTSHHDTTFVVDESQSSLSDSNPLSGNVSATTSISSSKYPPIQSSDSSSLQSSTSESDKKLKPKLKRKAGSSELVPAKKKMFTAKKTTNKPPGMPQTPRQQNTPGSSRLVFSTTPRFTPNKTSGGLKKGHTSTSFTNLKTATKNGVQGKGKKKLYNSKSASLL